MTELEVLNLLRAEAVARFGRQMVADAEMEAIAEAARALRSHNDDIDDVDAFDIASEDIGSLIHMLEALMADALGSSAKPN